MRYMQVKKIVASMVVLSCFMLSLLTFSQSAQAQQPQLVLEPNTSIVSVGSTFTVDIMAKDVIDLYGAEIYVTFNDNVVQVVDADLSKDGIQISDGEFLKDQFGYTSLNNVYYSPAPSEIGHIEYAAVRLDGSDSLEGDVRIATITFEVISAKYDTITLSFGYSDKNCKLSNSQATSINFSIENVSIINDNVPPKVISAEAISHNKIEVKFDEPIANPGDYSIEPNLAIIGSAVSSDETVVELITDEQTATIDKGYTLHIENVEDKMGNKSGPQEITFDGIGKIYMEGTPAYKDNEFTVDVKLSPLSAFYYAELVLQFDPRFMECVAMEVPSNIYIYPSSNFDNEQGSIICRLYAKDYKPISDFSGTVATLHFKAKSQIGNTSIDIVSANIKHDSSNSFKMDNENFSLEISSVGIVTGIVTADGGKLLPSVNVAVDNGTPAVVLLSNNSFMLNYLLPGTHTIAVMADAYISDVKTVNITANNIEVGFHLRAGDLVGGDNKVTLVDLAALSLFFGTVRGPDGWGPDIERADYNGDGIIDIFDLVLVAKNYGGILED